MFRGSAVRCKTLLPVCYSLVPLRARQAPINEDQVGCLFAANVPLQRECEMLKIVQPRQQEWEPISNPIGKQGSYKRTPYDEMGLDYSSVLQVSALTPNTNP